MVGKIGQLNPEERYSSTLHQFRTRFVVIPYKTGSTQSIFRNQFKKKSTKLTKCRFSYANYCIESHVNKSVVSVSTNKFVDIGQPTPASHPQLMKEGEITPGISAEEYITRRKRLLDLLP